MQKMASQRFCLRWNNHQSNLLSVFDQLLHAETFTDVTLAVEGQYLKAHKMVLSACSPYFNALFVNHPEKHTIVILKDVPYVDMKSLLDFMYRGEVSVDQERLTAFLRVAESLRIKGLTEVNDDKPTGPAVTPPPPQLHRIQPYLVQQRKAQQNMLMNSPLLGSALSMPKRKRGRPRKLSGSSNGTGNDFDEYDRDNLIQGSPEMLEVKMGTDGYSANEVSDDNNRDSGDNEQDSNQEPMDTSDTINKSHSHLKDTISEKDNDNNSTSDHVNNSPELTQRLLGTKIDRDPQTTSSLRQKLRMNASGQSQSAGSLLPPPPLNRISASSSSLQSNFSNSLLQQQLQNDSLNNNNSINNNNNSTSSPNNASNTTEIQLPVSSGNHYHQHFLMQMSNASASSPSSSSMPQKSSSNFYMDSPGHNLGEQNNFHMSDMADGYGGIGEAGGGSVDLLAHLKDGPPSPNSSHLQQMSRQPQRRRVRRKANSSLDEQAEHLTEMSVRGLDLFRYASITEGIYQCTECAKENVQKTFKNKYSFQRHAFLYHEGKHRKVFPCPVCGKEFSRPDKMKNHMKTTHECFLPKEVNSYNPFSYLLTAATATEIQQMFPPMDGISASSTVTGSGSGNATSTTTTATATSEPPASTVTASALSTSLTLAAGLAATTASPSFPSPSHSKSAKIGETKIQIKSESLFVKQESLLKATLASGTSAQLQEAEEVK